MKDTIRFVTLPGPAGRAGEDLSSTVDIRRARSGDALVVETSTNPTLLTAADARRYAQMLVEAADTIDPADPPT